jgi:type IV pilus assembly protein PilC
MPNFIYVALNEDGKKIKGSFIAENEKDLDFKLGEIGLEILSSKVIGESKLSFSFSKKIKSKDLILLCTHFEQLDKAGIPVTDSIEDLRDSAETVLFRDLMQDIYESVKAGKMLSEAMAEHPKIFEDVFVGLIAAGEKTGNLHQSFNYLAEHLKWSIDIKRKTQKAVRYPLFLLLILFCVTSVMMIYVIPKLSDFLLGQGVELPWYTNALLNFSAFFQNNWIAIITVPIILFFINRTLCILYDTYAYFVDKVKLGVPFLGSTLLKIDVARFSQFFLITFQSGIDVINCFDIVQRVVQNRVIKGTIKDIKQDISDGSSISASIKHSEQFPTLVIRMFEIGEQTGNMQDSLANVKFFYDKEVEDAVDALIGIIQPILTLIMGGLLLWISLSVFGPLYSSFSNIR